MLAGARVEVAPYKRDAMDFVLWKPSKPDEPAWPSPCGIAAPGRPGWHIECSAMAFRHLGETFDIHGGGIDLVFPHHENELAQTRCALGVERMASVWMHNGFLQVEGRKMAKSEGNFVTIKKAVHDWDGLVVRFAMLMTHYRKPMDWSSRQLREASRILESFKRWYECDLDPSYGNDMYPPFIEALSDDLNTPEAISKLHELIAVIDNSLREPDLERPRNISMLSNSLRLLGFGGIEKFDFNEVAARRVYGGAIDTIRIESLIAKRNDARNERNFAEADRIRDELAAMGVVLHDTKEATTWELKR
jgi:cysteinyl-tRNA synthetase